ncbi:hypothetical protein EFA69_07530 [Rufibacter immobilis]|uniref:Uncharacterized protein n=1 Tax=Rufibacter immobilis TaxID=1348778 RepID=A0A3M9MV75_9BACT|nr:hypothetical protein EFA69_07530 [Rufibacter immobilis]
MAGQQVHFKKPARMSIRGFGLVDDTNMQGLSALANAIKKKQAFFCLKPAKVGVNRSLHF